MSTFNIVLAALSLLISITTAWLTLFRRGTIEMTRPTVIYFGPDSRAKRDTPLPKVYVRALLFATSKRGRIVESMFARLSRNEAHQSFSIWVHGNQQLVRGSGLFVGETGIALNHHFLTPADDNHFRFAAGIYELEIYAHLLGDKFSKRLFAQRLEVTKAEAEAIGTSQAGLYFDWGPNSLQYLSHLDTKPPSSDELHKLLQRISN